MEETNKQKQKNEQASESTGNVFYDWLAKLFERFNVLSEFKETDGVLMVIAKVIVRILGFIILLLLSPFLLIGLMLAFAAAL